MSTHSSPEELEYRFDQPDEPKPDTGSSSVLNQSARVLRRSKQNRIIAGVAGGLGHYFDADPILFRLAFLLLLLSGGFGVLLYIIAWLLIPEFRTADAEVHDRQSRPFDTRIGGLVVGGGLVLIGTMILVQRLVGWFDIRLLGGGILILIGVLIVVRGLRNEESK